VEGDVPGDVDRVRDVGHETDGEDHETDEEDHAMPEVAHETDEEDRVNVVVHVIAEDQRNDREGSLETDSRRVRDRVSERREQGRAVTRAEEKSRRLQRFLPLTCSLARRHLFDRR